jgi:hypothetical protein
MSLVAQFDRRSAPPRISSATEHPPFRDSASPRSPGLKPRFLGVSLLIAGIIPVLQAEELTPDRQVAWQGPLLAFASAPARPDRESLQSVAVSEGPCAAEPIRFTDDDNTKSLTLPAVRAGGAGADPEFVLFQTKMRSRFAYESQTAIQTGYGQFFPDDKIGRSRTSGAGINDPDWVYVRICFSF